MRISDWSSDVCSSDLGMGTVVLDSFNGSPITPLTLVDTDGSFIPQTVSTSYGSLAITGFTPVIGADGSVIGGTFTYSYILGDNRLDHASAGQDSLEIGRAHV